MTTRATNGRVQAFLLVAFLVVGGCAGGGNDPAGVDDERVAKLRTYKILDTAPNGAIMQRPLHSSKALSANPMDKDFGDHHASIGWTVTAPISRVAEFYVNALRDQGWGQLSSYCGAVAKDRPKLGISAERSEGQYETAAFVELIERDGGIIQIFVNLTAPFHDENSLNTPSADLSCLDALK